MKNKAKTKRLIKRRIVGLVAVMLLLIVIAYVSSPKIPEPPESVQNVTELNAYLETLANSGSPPGLSMVIVKDDSIVYNKRFGKEQTGHIALQDHGNQVAFRNINIREL